MICVVIVLYNDLIQKRIVGIIVNVHRTGLARKIFIDRVDAGEEDRSQLTCHFIPPPPPSISAAAAALVSILLLAPSGSFNPLQKTI